MLLWFVGEKHGPWRPQEGDGGSATGWLQDLRHQRDSCVHGVWGAGAPPTEVDHQVQLPGPSTALRQDHHTTGNTTGRSPPYPGYPNLILDLVADRDWGQFHINSASELRFLIASIEKQLIEIELAPTLLLILHLIDLVKIHLKTIQSYFFWMSHLLIYLRYHMTSGWREIDFQTSLTNDQEGWD